MMGTASVSRRTRVRRCVSVTGAAIILWAASPGWVIAQDLREAIDAPPIENYDEILAQLEAGRVAAAMARGDNGLPNIVLTGYWPPTNEMIRRFSDNPVQNPQGWIGENWEGRGYNIYAFFPEFPNGGPNYGRGVGDFEVDYQDTSNDWWAIVPALSPIALITFSRAGADHDWEMEGGNRTYAANQWNNDYLTPLKPTPELPIMMFEPPGTERFSTQPMQAIVDAVSQQVPTLTAYIEPIDNGAFLSNFIGYHGNWYHDLHADPADPLYNIAGGHIHVGSSMSMDEAIAATEVTLRVLIAHVDAALGTPGDMNCDDTVDGADIAGFVLALTDGALYEATYSECDIDRADLDGSETLDEQDVAPFVDLLLDL